MGLVAWAGELMTAENWCSDIANRRQGGFHYVNEW